jgi:hypothetical protein
MKIQRIANVFPSRNDLISVLHCVSVVIRSTPNKRYPNFQSAHSTLMMLISSQPVLAWLVPRHVILLALRQIVKIPRDEAYNTEAGQKEGDDEHEQNRSATC